MQALEFGESGRLKMENLGKTTSALIEHYNKVCNTESSGATLGQHKEYPNLFGVFSDAITLESEFLNFQYPMIVVVEDAQSKIVRTYFVEQDLISNSAQLMDAGSTSIVLKGAIEAEQMLHFIDRQTSGESLARIITFSAPPMFYLPFLHRTDPVFVKAALAAYGLDEDRVITDQLVLDVLHETDGRLRSVDYGLERVCDRGGQCTHVLTGNRCIWGLQRCTGIPE